MPWGDNGKGKGPWGEGNPTPPSGSGGGNEPPDIDEIFKKGQERFNDFFKKSGGNNNKGNPLLIVFIALVVWLGSGLYVIEPEEQGVILRFGAYNRIADPGLNYHVPYPIETLYKVPVTTVNRVEVGVRSSSTGRRGGATRKVPAESLMLTGDENIVDVDFEVQWKIKNAVNFLFKVRDPSGTVKSVAESAMREVVGRTPIADALTEGRSAIESETKDIIQSMLDTYDSGIEVVRLQMREVQPPAAVIDSFRDVQTARADMERLRNQAETYRNDIIPRARGEAAKITQDAEAYKQQVVAKAQGEANRFVSVYEKYKNAKNVTKKRMYLETMEEILEGSDKILIDNNSQGSGVIPYLPLSELKK